MKNRLPLYGVLFSILLSTLLLQGCTVNYIVKPDAEASPYPNAWRVESRVRAQINRVSSALSQGRINQDTADILAENDELIRRIMREDQGPENNKVDLDENQTALLISLLSDNDRTIDDAIQRNQQWANYFQAGNYNYQNSDRTIYVVFLDYRLRQQETGLDSALEAGSFTPAQGKEIRDRINVIREMKRNYFRANGRFDLTEPQVRQLSRMIEDTDRFLKFRLRKGKGSWDRRNFTTLKNQKPVGWNENGGADWGKRNNNYLNPKTAPVNYQAPPANTPTAVPAAPAPTWTPRPLPPAFTPTKPPVNVVAPANTPTPQPEPPTPTATKARVWEKTEPANTSVNDNSKEGKEGSSEKASGPNREKKWNREGRGRGKGLGNGPAKEPESPGVNKEEKNPKNGEEDKKDSVDSGKQDSKSVEGDNTEDNSSEDQGKGKHGKRNRERGNERKDRNDN